MKFLFSNLSFNKPYYILQHQNCRMRLAAGKYYGTNSNEIRSDGFLFTERRYSPTAMLPAHSHERAHFCLVLNGIYRERIGSAEFVRTPSSLMYYPEEITHSEKHELDGRHFLIEVDPASVRRMNQIGARLGEFVSPQNELTLGVAAKMCREFSAPDEFTSVVLESLSFELLAATARVSSGREHSRRPRWFDVAIECLHADITSPPGLEGLAEVCGVHPTQVARAFQRFQRCTPGEYVRALRVRKACELLTGSHIPLAEITHELGFADQPHFTRTFKRETGLTPSEYRRVFRSV